METADKSVLLQTAAGYTGWHRHLHLITKNRTKTEINCDSGYGVVVSLQDQWV